MTVTDVPATASPPEVPGHQVVLIGAGFGAPVPPSEPERVRPQAPQLHKLYAKAKDKQWNASVDIDSSRSRSIVRIRRALGVPAGDGGRRLRLLHRGPEARGRPPVQHLAHLEFLHGEQGALLATSKLVAQVPTWTPSSATPPR
jgi:hypothetical protein